MDRLRSAQTPAIDGSDQFSAFIRGAPMGPEGVEEIERERMSWEGIRNISQPSKASARWRARSGTIIEDESSYSLQLDISGQIAAHQIGFSNACAVRRA